MVKIKYVYK